MAHDYLQIFRDAVIWINEDAGRIGYDGLAAMYSYALRARVDVGQLSAWLDEIERLSLRLRVRISPVRR